MGTRRTRRYKMRRPLFAFGQLMLPLVGIVALGLLVVGVKLFFLPGTGKTDSASIVSPESHLSAEKEPVIALPGEKKQEENYVGNPGKAENVPTPVLQTGSSIQIAVPVTRKDQPVAPQAKPKPQNIATPKVTSPPPSKPASGLGDYSWGVQVGAFTQRDQANSLMRKLQKTEGNVVITTGTVNGKTYYRVRVIAGKTRADAEKLEKNLRQKGYPTLVVHM
ncbi:MAG TPA: SPOR domain-containing protein [Synergistaceae bacterium]|nr:SPOR domain-containing protein [Synergistaceae bacterium]HPJ24792.1 SPOR domain-containing protein [Synergistaceae bacterium]HPQ36231.1 SPOR domain-containing protein [Synergistaceae bacterium]